MNFQFESNPIMMAMNNSHGLLNNQDANQLTSPKNICAICSDKASGKHYGVHR
jgi:hypothetical protein